MNPFHRQSLAEREQSQKRRFNWTRWRNFWERHWQNSISRIFILSGSFIFFVGGLFVFWVLKDIPSATEIKNLSLAESSVIYDASGAYILYNVHGEENRQYIPFDEISPNLGTAILAAEDADFYTHQGIDFTGMLRSVYFLIRTGEIHGGGSTLTQQVARNTLLTREQTLIRKIREIYLAFRLEHNFTKNEILELYLNKVSFGNNAFGVEQAAKTYFGKSARELSLAESIVLAALPQAPSKWSPYGPNKEVTLNVTPEFLTEHHIITAEVFWKLKTEDFSPVNPGLLGKDFEIASGVHVYAEGRADYVLGQMLEKGFVSELEYEKTKKELQKVTFIPYREEIRAPHFVFYIREILENELGKEVLEQSGLRIYTTLDYDLQKKAEELATENADTNDVYGISNIALAAVEPKTGFIKAMVGSRDYWSEEKTDGKVNIILQRRQPGSSFKPIVYAAGFRKGLSPATVVFDVKTKFGPIEPDNFDGAFLGPMSLRTALGHSRNIPAIKVGIIADRGAYDLAQNMGLQLTQDFDFYGSSLALGTGETRPLDLLQAYAIFATAGKKIPFTPILWVEDKYGKVILDYREPPAEPEEILDEGTAYLITNVLADPDARGEGWNSHLQLRVRQNAVKTGTSNAVDPESGVKFPNDTWTVGYTPQLATVVWAGNNRGHIPSHKASGWQNAAPYWKEFMEYAHEGKPVEFFERPKGIKVVAVDKFSGKLPAEGLPEEFVTTEVFRAENAPTEVGESLEIVEIDRASGKLPNEYTPPDAREKRVRFHFRSYNPELYPSWEAGVQTWVTEKGLEWIRGIDPQAKNFLTEIPTETENVHTAENAAKKPTVSLVSPVSFGVVTPPYVNVFPEILAPNGLKEVEIYWDEELKTTLKSSPWNTKINIGTPEHGSTHTLRVRALDQFYYADESTINVKIGSDDSPPAITFLFPKKRQEIAGGVLHSLRVNAVDTRSAVDKVIFSINGKMIGTAVNIPFEVSWNAPNIDAYYQLGVKAFDTAGNVVEQEIEFSTTGKQGIASDSFGILQPKNGTVVTAPILVSAGITNEQARSFGGLEIWYRRPGGAPKVMKSFSSNELPETRIFSMLWEGSAGDFELWSKVKLSSGGDQISQKVKITIREERK